ncbi:MAG: Nif3-like dinuclear metal center hexameric protein [Candidatus Micrarchaeota archaeon]
MLAREIIDYMKKEKLDGPGLAYEDDLTGLVFGDPEKEIKRIGVAWAATEYVFEQAGILSASTFAKTRRITKQKQFKFDKKKQETEEETVDMLVLHEYPFFEEIPDRFPGLSFFEKPVNYKRLKDLITKGVCVYVAHSNLDEAEGGTSDLLAKTLGIKITGRVKCGRWGKIPELSLANLIANLKASYGIDVVRVVGDPETNKKFETIGCFIGDGLANIDVVEEFFEHKCQALVSSGLTEEIARYASELGFVLVDVERSKLERPVMNLLAEKMQADLKNTFVNLYECEDVIAYI